MEQHREGDWLLPLYVGEAVQATSADRFMTETSQRSGNGCDLSRSPHCPELMSHLGRKPD